MSIGSVVAEVEVDAVVPGYLKLWLLVVRYKIPGKVVVGRRSPQTILPVHQLGALLHHEVSIVTFHLYQIQFS